jgi:hypothetical protein
LIKNTLSAAIKFDISQTVMLMKLDDVGFVYDVKNNKSITSNRTID